VVPRCNVLLDQQPVAIVFPADERDVMLAVDYARRRGYRIAPQATGHNAGPLGSLENTLIVHVSDLDQVSIDAAARRVRVGAGVKWEKVTGASAFFDAESWARLRAVKAAYDPQDMFRGNHHVPPAEAGGERLAA